MTAFSFLIRNAIAQLFGYIDSTRHPTFGNLVGATLKNVNTDISEVLTKIVAPPEIALSEVFLCPAGIHIADLIGNMPVSLGKEIQA